MQHDFFFFFSCKGSSLVNSSSLSKIQRLAVLHKRLGSTNVRGHYVAVKKLRWATSSSEGLTCASLLQMFAAERL